LRCHHCLKVYDRGADELAEMRTACRPSFDRQRALSALLKALERGEHDTDLPCATSHAPAEVLARGQLLAALQPSCSRQQEPFLLRLSFDQSLIFVAVVVDHC
jgi:hypothetical protein